MPANGSNCLLRNTDMAHFKMTCFDTQCWFCWVDRFKTDQKISLCDYQLKLSSIATMLLMYRLPVSADYGKISGNILLL